MTKMLVWLIRLRWTLVGGSGMPEGRERERDEKEGERPRYEREM